MLKPALYVQEMIPLTTMPVSSDENTPLHHQPRRRPVLHEHGVLGGYGSPGLPTYGPRQHQQLVVRGSPRHYGQYVTASAPGGGAPHYVVRQGQAHVEQPPPSAAAAAVDVESWKDAFWRLLTCDGLCSGGSSPAGGVAVGGKRRSQALMVDVVSRVLFPIFPDY